MEALSLTSPTAPEHNSGDTDSATDAEIPPIQWDAPNKRNGKTMDELYRDFVAYYKERGWAYDENTRTLLPRAYHCQADYNGETYLRNTRVQEGGFGHNAYDEDFVVHTRPASALSDLEAERLKLLGEARGRLAEAQRAPDGPGQTQKIRGIEQEIRRLQNQVAQFVPPVCRSELEDPENPRQCDLPNDIAGNNSRKDTMFKFKPILDRMSKCGALGEEEVVVGPDLKKVKQNRTWAEGNIWRPLSESKDWADWDHDEQCTSTFHSFIPRHPRPPAIGFDHLGYDQVYTRARDGVWYTADDVPDATWQGQLNAPILFESEDGEKYTVDKQISNMNPAVKFRDKVPKALHTWLLQNRAANSGKASYQGRGWNRGRGGARRGGARRGGAGREEPSGGFSSHDASWA